MKYETKLLMNISLNKVDWCLNVSVLKCTLNVLAKKVYKLLKYYSNIRINLTSISEISEMYNWIININTLKRSELRITSMILINYHLLNFGNIN